MSSLQITVSPGPRTNAHGRSVPLDGAEPVACYAQVLDSLRGEDAWYAAGTYREGHRCNEDWQGACAVTGDLDYLDAQGRHAAPSADARAALDLALADAPGCIAYHTPRGARVDAVLEHPVTDGAVWQRAADGLLALLATWLRRHRLDADKATGLAGYSVDLAARKPAQFMFGPRARVDGVERDGSVRVLRPVPYAVEDLLAAAPAPVEPVKAKPTRPSQALAHFEKARAAFDSDHPLTATKRGSPCPVTGCEGKDSFKGDASKATCFHSSHPDKCGTRGQGCFVFDSLDLEAFNAGRTPREHLIAEGYYCPAPVREEPPPPGDVDRPPEVQITSAAEPWPEPGLLSDELLPVDPLGSDLLPPALHDWLADVAERMQVPLEFPAAAAVVAAGSLLGGRCAIRPKRHDDWTVHPNIWGAIVGQPGLMKSPAVAEGLKPLRRLAVDAHQVHEQATREWKVEQEVAKARATDRQRRLREAVKDDNAADLERLKAELAHEPTGPLPPSIYIVNDSTTEKLIELAQASPRGFVVYRDELSGLFAYLVRDGHENDRALYTEAWEPKPYRQDRIGRGTVYVDLLCMSLFGTIQPGPLFRHIRAALKSGEGADGFLQRFQLLVYPDVPVDWRNVDRFPDTARKNAAFRLFKALDAIPPRELGAVLDDEGRVPHFRFDPGGQEVFDAWRADLERTVRSPDLHPALAAHLAKYRKLMPSLALVFHLLELVEHARTGQVPAAAAMRAVEWCRLLEQHARRVYAAATSGDVAGARVLAEKLRAGALADGFTARDVYRHHWAGLADPDEVDAALARLLDAGWLRRGARQTVGRPLETFVVNPLVGRSFGTFGTQGGPRFSLSPGETQSSSGHLSPTASARSAASPGGPLDGCAPDRVPGHTGHTPSPPAPSGLL